MIIVKRTVGDVFINEKTVTSIMHDKPSKSVLVKDVEGKPSDAFYEVESVVYTNDAKPTSWKDEGSEIQQMKATIEKKDKEYDQMMEYLRFIRECFFIYQNAFYDIKTSIENYRNVQHFCMMILQDLQFSVN